MNKTEKENNTCILCGHSEGVHLHTYIYFTGIKNPYTCKASSI